MNEIVECGGRRYVWTGSRWYGERDFLTPPGVIIHRLEALRPHTARSEASDRDCPKSLKARWPDPLATDWLERYPHLFDADDYRCVTNQPTKHFWEWYAAIYLFKRDGAYSMVEKYDSKQEHAEKRARLASILSPEQLRAVRAVSDELWTPPKTQMPDLFVYMPDASRFWFAEAKGPSDDVRPNQARSHEIIERELGVPVEVLWFGLVDG